MRYSYISRARWSGSGMALTSWSYTALARCSCSSISCSVAPRLEPFWVRSFAKSYVNASASSFGFIIPASAG